MTISQLLQHPEFPHVHWNLQPQQSGKIEVAKGRRGGPFNLWYEIHGHGPIHLVVGTTVLPSPGLAEAYSFVLLAVPMAYL
jgi:hypothetical protein